MRTYWLMGKTRHSSDFLKQATCPQVIRISVNQGRNSCPQACQVPAGRVAKVRPYTFFSAGQLVEGRPLDRLALQRQQQQQEHLEQQVQESQVHPSALSDHLHISRTVSLGHDSKKVAKHLHQYLVPAVFQSRSESDCNDCRLAPCAPVDEVTQDDRRMEADSPQQPRSIAEEPREGIICRKVHGYSWNDLWSGLHRGSLKMRSDTSDERTVIPDFC